MMVGIIGCGQIGGSIALKLSETDDVNLVIYDKDPETLELLKNRIPKAIVANDQREILEDERLDFLILAIPIGECIKMLEREEFLSSYILMDVCSVKGIIMDTANKRNLRFIGGHPIAGNERMGPDGWDKEMFKQRKFCVCKGVGVLDGDLKKSIDLIERLEAMFYEIDPQNHDELLGYTSHMTYLVSLALRLTCENHSALAGPGYQSTTRVGRQNPNMSLEILKFNKENVLNSLEKFKESLNDLERVIEHEDWERFLKFAGGG